MLGKLFKYEFKSTARWMLPCYAFVILVSFVNMFFISVNPYSANPIGNTLINSMRVLFAITYGISVTAMSMLTIFMAVSRFYKNLLSNEGYISLTLPVSIDEHLSVKLITATLWIFASVAIGVLSLFILTAREIQFYQMLRELPRAYAFINTELNGMLNVYVFEVVLLTVVATAEIILRMYFSMALGQLSNNHKIGMAIVAYIGINFIMQIISMVFTVNSVSRIIKMDMFAYTNVNASNVYTALSQYGFISIIWEIIIATGFYIGTRYILSKRVNLQ